MKEYIIIGDTKDYTGCLVTTCGTRRENAEEVLRRFLNNPTEHDKRLFAGHKNLRIKETEREQNWWNDAYLAN